MWKKVLIILIALAGTYSAGYALNHIMSASSVYGSEELSIGNKIIIGSDSGSDIVWDIVSKKGDTYVLLSSDILKSHPSRCNKDTKGNVMGTKAHVIACDYTSTNEYQTMKLLNTNLLLTEIKIAEVQTDSSYVKYDQTYIFLPTAEDIRDGGRLGLTSAERTLSTANYKYNGVTNYGYYVNPDSKGTFKDPFGTPYTSFVAVTGVTGTDVSGVGKVSGGTISATWGGAIDDYTIFACLRLAAEINSNNIVVALDRDAVEDAWNSINTPSSTFGNGSTGQALQLRIHNTGYLAQLYSLQMKDKDERVFQTNDTIQVKASANANATNSNVVSALIYDSSGLNLRYYRPLAKAKGNGTYDMDLTGIPTGSYQIAILNEDVRTSDDRPVDSSQISNKLAFDIIEYPEIAYTENPQTQDTYEYNVNVKATMEVGKVSRINSITPVTYEIVSYDGTDTTFGNFEISGLDASGSSSAASLDVKIKSDAKDLVSSTKSLKAGTYKFCIIAKDENGNPKTPVDDKTKVCTTLKVEKTNPTIEFTSDDKGTIYVKGDVANTVTHSESATHSNGDATANDVGIVYSMLSDPSSIMQSGLPFTSAKVGDVADIVFKANASGTVEIQALIPESANYKEAKTNKKIIVQLALTGSYVEDQLNITAGSTVAKPPASYSQANRIGHINVSGGTSPFSYSLPAGKGNNGSFYIDTNGNIYVNQSVTNGLTPGNYDIEVDITDTTSPTKQTANVKKTITILPASLSGVAWLDPATGKALSGNTITFTYDPSKNGGSFNTKLLETTTDSLANTNIQYSLSTDPNDAISITSTPNVNEVSVTVKKASDTTTKDKVKIIASITGGRYGSTPVTTEVYVNVEKYTQTIAFSDTTKLKLPAGSGCVSVLASITSTYSIPNGVIQYKSSNTSVNAPFTIDADGKVCPTSHAGSASLTGTLLGNENFTDATTPVSRVIEVYEPGAIEVSGSIQAVTGASGVNYTVGTLLKAHDSSTNKNGTAKINEQAAKVEDTESSSPKYAPSSNQGNKNADESLFNVMPTGYITLKQDITASDIQNHGTGNIYYIQVDVTDDNGYTKTVDVEIKIADADADFYFIDPISGAKLPLDHVYDDGKTKIAYYTTSYVPNGTIDIKTNLGSTYSEDTVGDSDVIDALNKGSFTILNASDPTPIYGGLGGNTYVKGCMTKKPGYSDPCIYAQVEITKAEQPDFAFVQSPTWTLGKTPAIITPIYNDQLSTGDVIIQSISDTTIAEIESPVAGSNQSFKTTGKAGTTKIKATAPADRNYNSKEAETTLIITDKPPTTLSIFVPSMTYGDTGSQAQITNGYKQGVPAYFYVDDTSILTVDGNPVNSKDSPAFTANGSGQVTVKVCQTNDPFDPATDDCNAIGGDYGELTITVKKKPLTLAYEDEEIYAGEDFPAYRFIIPSQSSFVAGDSMSDFPVPANTSAKEQGTALADTKTAGTYAISGSYTTGELTGNALHYEVTIQAGELTIKQDTVLDSWYHLEDPQGNTVNKNDWHNYFVDVVLDTAKGDGGIYDQISNTNTFTNADKTRFTVNEEDENLEDVYFRIDPNGSEAHKGSITSTQTTIKIDMTVPEITSITGYPVNTDGLSNLLHEITLGHFFKPGVEVTIQAIDPQPANSQSSKVSGIEKVEYKVYALDDKGIQTSQTAVDSNNGVTDINGNMSFKINKIGNYRVCATTTDYASNPAKEKCADLNIHKIDVDEDGDGEPDFNDSDNDGCPDLNIVLGEDSDGNMVKLNVAEKGKEYPYMNIDSNGDGKPDLNIDTDNDGRPDVNLVILTETMWESNICVNKEQLTDYTQPNKYCTGTKAKPLINVVVDNGKEDIKDQIPSLNIDNNGDMEPDLNISKDGKTPQINLVKLHEWKPKHDYAKDDFFYDSIGSDKDDPKPELNIDTNGDGYPDVNIDFDMDGEPDLNIDLNKDGIPDINIDSTGDGKADINIDTDRDGSADDRIVEIESWNPIQIIEDKKEFPYGTCEEIPYGYDKLVDAETKIEIESGTDKFLPNFAIKVNDITGSVEPSMQEAIQKHLREEEEVKTILDIFLTDGDQTIQPNGNIKVRIPVIESIEQPRLLMQGKDGSWKEVTFTIENGYYVYETEHLGLVSILGNKLDSTQEPTDTSNPVKPDKPSTSVQGTYTTQADVKNGVGGAQTGDSTSLMTYGFLFLCSITVFYRLKRSIK